MNKRPFSFRVHWDGKALVPDARTADYCIRNLGEGEVILLERNEERSEASHKHFFAWLHEAWLNLPERLATEYPTSDALRIKALIRTGYSRQRDVVCKTASEATSVAAVCQMIRAYDIIEVSGNVVRIFSAKSMSRRAMNKKEFQDSKDAVMGYVSGLIGISPEEISRNAGKAA
jgi:hypothetical protein